MAADRTVAAGPALAAGRSGSPAPGLTLAGQRPFVFEQDGGSLGVVALLFWAVENGV